MYILLIIIAVLLVGGFIFLQQDTFGAKPGDARLERIKKSKNFKNGAFQNQSYTPTLAKGYNYAGILYDFLIKKKENLKPTDSLPFVKTNLKALPPSDVLIWFGHSSYLMQLEGKTFLIDPVFSGYASPIPGTNKAFKGSDRYTVEDLPPIDYLIITHDHYDHLDYETIKKLKNQVGKVICALGVGAHFEKWGYQPTQLIENDWGDEFTLDNLFKMYLTPARHFSGRSLSKNNTLWTSYVLETPSKRIFIGGDSGYDKHFAEIGRRFKEFDLAILENGQYNEAWRYIHTLPDEVLKVAKELGAKRLLPVHSGKFDLGGHPWNEPLTKLTELNKTTKLPLATPMIGEVVELDNPQQKFSKWWEM